MGDSKRKNQTDCTRYMSACSSGPSCNASSTSCRDVRDGILLPPRGDELPPSGDELPVDGVRVQHEHGARLSRDCRPHGISLLPYDGEPRAHDVRRLSYDVLLLALTFRPPSNLYSRSGNPQVVEYRKSALININATTIAL